MVTNGGSNHWILLDITGYYWILLDIHVGSWCAEQAGSYAREPDPTSLPAIYNHDVVHV